MSEAHPLTEQQQAYAIERAAGSDPREAARRAGYAHPARSGRRLERSRMVAAAIRVLLEHIIAEDVEELTALLADVAVLEAGGARAHELAETWNTLPGRIANGLPPLTPEVWADGWRACANELAATVGQLRARLDALGPMPGGSSPEDA